MDFLFLQELPEGEWFCCGSCSGTRLSLEKIISDGAQPLAEPDIEIIRMKHEIRGLCMDTSTDLKWQLLSGKRATEDGRILLSAAVPIFHVGPVLFDLICSSSALFSGLSIFVLFPPFNAFSYGHLMVIYYGKFCLILGGCFLFYFDAILMSNSGGGVHF